MANIFPLIHHPLGKKKSHTLPLPPEPGEKYLILHFCRLSADAGDISVRFT